MPLLPIKTLPDRGIIWGMDSDIADAFLQHLDGKGYKLNKSKKSRNVAWYKTSNDRYANYIQRSSDNPSYNLTDYFDTSNIKIKKSKKIKSQYLIFN